MIQYAHQDPLAGRLHRIYGCQRGQSSMEYAFVCAALTAALFVPIQDAESPDRARTTVEIILDGFKTAYQKFSYAISLPT